MDEKKSYVVGFLFDETLRKICLIKKNRPAWQAGRLNGVGGHIENGEEPLVAMQREFEEEAGILIPHWFKFGYIFGSTYELHLFIALKPIDCNPRSMTDEEIGWYDIDNLPTNIISNLKWIIPLALYEEKCFVTVEHESEIC